MRKLEGTFDDSDKLPDTSSRSTKIEDIVPSTKTEDIVPSTKTCQTPNHATCHQFEKDNHFDSNSVINHQLITLWTMNFQPKKVALIINFS